MNEDAVRRFQRGALEELDPYLKYSRETLIRVYGLIETSEKIFTINREVSKDILRSAVVFTHATLEDFLRTISSALLPLADEKVLNEVPLVDINSAGRPEKFYLGKLVNHKGKTVDEIIRLSVDRYLLQSNFNNQHEIASMLENLGFDLKIMNLQECFSLLSDMMTRRHLIVHRADKILSTETSELVLQDINETTVRCWVDNVKVFIQKISSSLFIKLNTSESLKEKYNVILDFEI